MSQDEFSYFQTGSGLPLAGATVQVIGSQFVIDNSYATGAVVASLTMKPQDEAQEAQTQLYSVGGKFEPADMGARVVHQSGKNVRINNQSNYGKWIDHCLTMDGADAFLQEARSRGLEPNSAALWLGMWFELGTLEYKAMNAKDDDPPKTLIVPVKYLGASEVVGGAVAVQPVSAVVPGARPGGAPGGPPRATPPVAAPSAGPPAAAPGGRTMPPRPGAGGPPGAPGAPAAAPPSAPSAPVVTQAFTGVIDGVDQAWTDFAIATAAANSDFNQFVDAIMNTEGVTDLPLLQKAIMSQKEGSLWATHHG